MEEGAITNPEALAARVNRLKRASGITAGNVIGSVNGLYSIARILTFPPGTTGDLARELPEQAREIMPAEDHRLLWQTMRTDGERGQQVLAVWANDRQIDTLLAPLRSAGLQPKTLEFKAVALVRAVNRSHGPHCQPRALQHGHSSGYRGSAPGNADGGSVRSANR